MNTPLAVCLLAVSIAVGDSTLDESCSNSSGICPSSGASCPIGFDKPCTLQLESIGAHKPLNFQSMLKICVRPRVHDEAFMVINMGQAGIIVTNLNCCMGADCKMNMSHVASRNKTFNGRTCPACYALAPLTCGKKEVALCAGNEHYCLSVFGTITLGKLATWITMKGCANDATCKDVKQDSYSIPWGTVLKKQTCYLASKGVTPMPALVGYFLLVLTGFQALEVDS